MQMTIYKYQLKTTDTQEVVMPKGAEILTVQTQNETPCIWALVAPNAGTEVRKFRIFGTGHPADNTIQEMRYVGTYQLRGGSLVFHVFELPR